VFVGPPAEISVSSTAFIASSAISFTVSATPPSVFWAPLFVKTAPATPPIAAPMTAPVAPAARLTPPFFPAFFPFDWLTVFFCFFSGVCISPPF
jgi:hypothetical protein